MNARRGLAPAIALLASASAVTGAAAAGASGAAAAVTSSHPTICVALVVDARSIGSDVSTSCAKVPKGASGLAVLQAGGHRVSFRGDGLLCTIDGLPKTGCAGIDDSHYWAYFHRAPGSTKWAYSSEGPASYQPVNDSTEGWVYDNGKALTPENVPYRRICTTAATPTASASSSPSVKPSSAVPTALPTHTSRPASSPHATVASTPATHSHSPSASGRHRSHQPAVAAVATSPAGTDLPSSGPSPLPSSVQLTGGTDTSSHGSGRLGLLLGALVVAALGVAAYLRSRRSPR
jgi:hypothetical protein